MNIWSSNGFLLGRSPKKNKKSSFSCNSGLTKSLFKYSFNLVTLSWRNDGVKFLTPIFDEATGKIASLGRDFFIALLSFSNSLNLLSFSAVILPWDYFTIYTAYGS